MTWAHEYGQRVEGTYTVGTQPATSAPPPDVRGLLVAAGITPVSPVRECKDARRRSATGQSWIVVLPKGAKIPANVIAAFEPGWYRDGNIIVVELKRVG